MVGALLEINKFTNDPLTGLVIPAQRKQFDFSVVDMDNGARYAFNLTQTNIDIYYQRRYITIVQFKAAERLYADYYHAKISARLKSSLNIPEAGITSGGVKTDNTNYEAWERYERAIASITSKRVQKLVYRCVVVGDWLGDINNICIPTYKRMELFTDALDSLIKHYGDGKRVKRVYTSGVTTVCG